MLAQKTTPKTILLFNCAAVIFFIVLFTVSTIEAYGGIAVSGSFARHHYKMLPGESIDTPHINVVVFNNYDRDIAVALTPRLPDGVEFHLDEYEISIPANSSIDIPMGLTVGTDVVPDEYTIGLAADVLPDAETGIAVVGSAELRTKLSIFGEAGRVNIKTVTVEEELIRATLNLSRKEGNSLSPAGYSNTGQLEERLIPGTYVVIAYWEGTEIASREFELAADEEKQITLVAQTVFIKGFTATPQYYEASGDLANARLTYTIDNIYRPLDQVRAVLIVNHRGSLIDELEMFAQPRLELGSQDHRYTYIPPDGWQSGEYLFKVELYAEEDILYAISRDQFIEIEGFYLSQDIIIGLIGGVVLFVLYFLWRRRRKCKECDGDGTIECEKCSGKGYIKANGKKYRCPSCNSKGEVPCPKCQDK